MILLVDNYDSFSYNLYQVLGSGGDTVRVMRNDAISVHEIRAIKPDHIVLSPGPGRPEDAGRTMEIITAFAGEIPMLGVCLGHQAICAVYGTTITYASKLMHGKQSEISADTDTPLFRGLPARFQVGRYHSLAADAATLSDKLIVTAKTDDGEIMAIQHKSDPVFGVQFHPESILTPDGAAILNNFLEVR